MKITSRSLDCKSLLQMAYSLCEWFMQTYGDWNYQNQKFVMPIQVVKPAAATQAVKEAEDKVAENLIEQAQKKATQNTVTKAEHKKQGNKVRASVRNLRLKLGI